MFSRLGTRYRKFIPLAVAGVSCFTLGTTAYCDVFSECAKQVIAPYSPEAGLSYEKSAHWSALARSRSHLVCTMKNCTDFRLKLINQWERDDVHRDQNPAQIRYSFPKRFKEGETHSQVYHSLDNLRFAHIWKVQGTNKILAIVHRERQKDEGMVMEQLGGYHNLLNHHDLPIYKGFGLYFGKERTPLQIWKLTARYEERVSKTMKDGSVYCYEDCEPASIIGTLDDGRRVKVSAGFDDHFISEIRVCVEQLDL